MSPRGLYGFAGAGEKLPPGYVALQQQHMQSSISAGGKWVPFLHNPTAKKAAHQLKNQTSRGDRVRDISDAQGLRTRLDDQGPKGPEEPSGGFTGNN